MMDFRFQILVFCSVILFSCTVQLKTSDEAAEPLKESGAQIIPENSEENIYTGWWVYGEGQHIFKDEVTLEEFDLVFLNENMQELTQLYLSVCEMEYFPLECIMQGNLQNKKLEITDFEITYIQGCGE